MPPSNHPSERLEWLSLMRGLSIVLVVMFHVQLVDMATGENHSLCTTLPTIFTPIRMPFFIFTSGGLLYLSRIRREWTTRALYADKLRRIAIPFVFFVTFYYLFKLLAGACIIRKTKRFAIPERAVYFLKTKRTAGVLPHPKNFRPAYAGIHIMQERGSDGVRTPFFSFCRFAPAFRASRYAASLNALYAATLCALTSLPRKARREPTPAFACEAS